MPPWYAAAAAIIYCIQKSPVTAALQARALAQHFRRRLQEQSGTHTSTQLFDASGGSNGADEGGWEYDDDDGDDDWDV
jgi:hypothetical protein